MSDTPEPAWKQAAWANHQQFVRRANAAGKLTSDAEIVNFIGLAICGEAGELANELKKVWRGDVVDPKELRHELADIRIFVEHMATYLGVNLDDLCAEKVAIVAERLQRKPLAE